MISVEFASFYLRFSGYRVSLLYVRVYDQVARSLPTDTPTISDSNVY